MNEETIEIPKSVVMGLMENLQKTYGLLKSTEKVEERVVPLRVGRATELTQVTLKNLSQVIPELKNQPVEKLLQEGIDLAEEQ
jgi:hypothetical protein